MNPQERFERILAALHEAVLDDSHSVAASALTEAMDRSERMAKPFPVRGGCHGSCIPAQHDTGVPGR